MKTIEIKGQTNLKVGFLRESSPSQIQRKTISSLLIKISSFSITIAKIENKKGMTLDLNDYVKDYVFANNNDSVQGFLQYLNEVNS